MNLESLTIIQKFEFRVKGLIFLLGKLYSQYTIMAGEFRNYSEAALRLAEAERIGLLLSQATELAAVAAASTAGKGDKTASDQAAVDVMRDFLNNLDIKGRIVIGEGEKDKAPMLFNGEPLGTGKGPELDLAVDPLEGTTATAKKVIRSASDPPEVT